MHEGTQGGHLQSSTRVNDWPAMLPTDRAASATDMSSPSLSRSSPTTRWPSGIPSKRRLQTLLKAASAAGSGGGVREETARAATLWRICNRQGKATARPA